MRKLLLILGIIILIKAVALSAINLEHSASIIYYPWKNPATMDMGLLIFAIAAFAGLGTFLICLSNIIDLNFKFKKQSRNAEKASISSEESSDKIKVLQAKIDTLEVALKDALSRK